MNGKFCPSCGKENSADAKECIYCLSKMTPKSVIKDEDDNETSVWDDIVAARKEAERKRAIAREEAQELNMSEVKPLCKGLYTCGVIVLCMAIVVAIMYIVDGVASEEETILFADIIHAATYFFGGIISLYTFKWMAFMLKTNYEIKERLK